MTKQNYESNDNSFEEEHSDKVKLDENTTNDKTKRQISILDILKYSTTVDYVYIIVGVLGAIIGGCGWPGLNILFGTIVNVFVQFEVDYQVAIDAGHSTDQVVSDFMNTIYVMSAAMAGITVVFIVGNYTAIHCFQMFSLRQMGVIKKRYFKSILTQEVAWFDQQSSGEFASRISSDFKKFEAGINENLGLLIYNISTSILNLIIGLIYGWKLSLVIISTAPIFIIGSFVITRLQSRYMQHELKSYSIATSVAEEAISAIRTVFAFGGQQKECGRYEHSLKPAMSSGIKRNLVTALGNSINWSTLYGSFALGVWYGVKLITSENENYNIGDVVVVFWTITSTGFYIGYAAPYLESFQIARTAALSIYEIINRPSVIDSSSKDGVELGANYRTNIELKNIHFCYPTRPDVTILSGLDLKINSGEIVALVGSSGCGKSTIIQLIQRFYDPDCGEILLDGTNLKDLNIGWLREQIGVVGQEPVLFDASIEENIRLGSGLSTNLINTEDISHAAEQANAHEFIRSLQDGYQTYVGDRGAQLSGGQKQRIAIARALISKPKILLLDEATSALDLQSETVVQAALDRASQGRTTIIVAHRLSTIINADRIIFLQKGKVLEMGTHQELINRKSAYYNLVLAQQVENNADLRPKDIAKIPEIERSDSHSYSLARHGSSFASIRASMRIEGSLSLSQNDYDDMTTPVQEEELSQTNFPYSRVFHLIRSESGLYFTIALLSALAYGLVTPIYALIFGSFVDEFTVVGVEDDPEYLQSETIKYSIFYACLACGIFVCNTTQITLFGIVGERLTMRLRMMAFSAILTQEVAWFDEPTNSAGALCSRLANDAANIQGATGLRIAMMCQALSTLVCSILVGFLYNWRMALGGLALMPIVATSAVVSSKLYSGQAKQDGQTAQQSSKVMIEVMNAVRTVVSLHKQQYFYDKFVQTLNDHYFAIKGKIFAKAIVISISLGIPFFAYSIAFLYGGFLMSNRYLGSGDFFRIIESMVFGSVVVGQTAILSSDFTKAKLAAVSIFRLIDRQPPCNLIKDSEKSVPQIEKSTSDRSQGNVSFRGVHFNYPSRPGQSILNGLSFSAHKGETVALVGSSGCGKSTSIQLLEQFYECSKGKIHLDGDNIAQLNTNWVRSQMALVSQEPILFSYSIKDNIAYGDNSHTVPFDEIVRAAQMANVHEFIQQLPLGYDTPVGSKGTQLSGGQKQRIAIARALVRDPPILLLDEATSALDTASEKIVQEALNEASRGRTCLVIAHRLKTIVNAHKIVVIHKGVNVEEGTHEELLERKGFYWKLYNSAVAN